ncbi:NAD(P)-binding protein [Opitutales bacterium]|nr:NAD(P)-binding protein [Opitutales bacterium]
MNTTIIGAGLAGLSCSYHLGHDKCLIFEKNTYTGGHIFSHFHNGYVWDEGPHVSFTENEYVQKLFYDSVNGELNEFECNVSNWYQDSWIPHPAQSNLYAIPEPLRSKCLKDFLKSRNQPITNNDILNYGDWLKNAFGKTFADTFPATYTEKYWTSNPSNLTTDWIGKRVFNPDIETVKKGFYKPAEKSTHYIKKVRYPKEGGYVSFAKNFKQNSNVLNNHQVEQFDLKERKVFFTNGTVHNYERLINTLPLNAFIGLCNSCPEEILNAAKNLACTSLLLVNVTAEHESMTPYHWMYVYDKNKYSTRINQVNLLSECNTPYGKIGIQVEVYLSRGSLSNVQKEIISKKVIQELIEMKLIKKAESVHTQFIPYANVIFDHNRRENLNYILEWLTQFGLEREDDDLEPTTTWSSKKNVKIGRLALAGRYGQWNYYWSDDCVLRGSILS